MQTVDNIGISLVFKAIYLNFSKLVIDKLCSKNTESVQC